MIVALRSSGPTCEIYLLSKEGKERDQKKWLAERRLAKELLGQLEIFLEKNNLQFKDLTGLIVFRGPGSYTGLRIGVNVMNALAYALAVPIVGEISEDWLNKGTTKLKKKVNNTMVIPEYGGMPHITLPKK